MLLSNVASKDKARIEADAYVRLQISGEYQLIHFHFLSINTPSLFINYKQSNATIIIKSLTPGRFDSLMLHSLNANLTQDHIEVSMLLLESDGKANKQNITKRITKRRRLTSIEKSLIVAALTVEGSKVIDPLYFTTG